MGEQYFPNLLQCVGILLLFAKIRTTSEFVRFLLIP
jgi:hypothetical protein